MNQQLVNTQQCRLVWFDHIIPWEYLNLMRIAPSCLFLHQVRLNGTDLRSVGYLWVGSLGTERQQERGQKIGDTSVCRLSGSNRMDSVFLIIELPLKNSLTLFSFRYLTSCTQQVPVRYVHCLYSLIHVAIKRSADY